MNSFDIIKPFLRYAQIVTIINSAPFINMTAYDFRLFFVKSGSGSFIVGGKEYTAAKGALILWKPGIEYSLLTDSKMELIGMNFDLTFSASHLNVAIPPSSRENFDKTKILEPDIAEKIGFLNEVIYFENQSDAELRLLKLYSEFKNKLRLYVPKTSGMLLSFLTDVARRTEQTPTPSPDSKIINEILKLINENYNEPLSNESIGKALGYHPNHISRLMVSFTGMPLHKYLQNFRIEKAMDLLQMTNLHASQICEMCGFNDFSHFSKYFKKITGYSPSEYRIK